jgi:hypothetical protein
MVWFANSGFVNADIVDCESHQADPFDPLLFRILYLRFRLWLLRRGADIRNAIGDYLLRCLARLAAVGVWLSKNEP